MSAISKEMLSYLEAQKASRALAADDNVDDAALEAAFKLVDTELDKLILSFQDAEADPPDDDPRDSEWAEKMQLYQQADGAKFLQLAATDQQPDGAEAELLAALKVQNSNTLPLGLLLPREERVADIPDEVKLADEVTSITTTTTINTEPIAARVFKGTVARSLGITMPTVPAGQRDYPFLTSGPSAQVVGPGESVDADAATIDTVSVRPVAIQGTFILDYDTIMLHGKQVQTLLETDLRTGVSLALDSEILLGDGADPVRTKGLFPFIKDAYPSSGDLTKATEWAEAESIAAEFVDGLYFMEDTATRMLIGIDTYKFLRRLYPPSGGDRLEPVRHALGAIRSDGVTVYTRDWPPPSVPATSGTNGKYQQSLYMGGVGPGNIIVPVWDSVDLLVDPYTAGRRRQVIVTMHMYFGLAYRRRTLDGSDNTIGAIPGVKKINWVATDDS